MATTSQCQFRLSKMPSAKTTKGQQLQIPGIRDAVEATGRAGSRGSGGDAGTGGTDHKQGDRRPDRVEAVGTGEWGGSRHRVGRPAEHPGPRSSRSRWPARPACRSSSAGSSPAPRRRRAARPGRWSRRRPPRVHLGEVDAGRGDRDRDDEDWDQAPWSDGGTSRRGTDGQQDQRQTTIQTVSRPTATSAVLDRARMQASAAAKA